MDPLRPYQQELVEQIAAAYKAGAASLVLQLGTGGGKTKTASNILERAVARGHRCLFLAHLDSLIEDTHDRLVAAGVRAGFVQAGRPSDPEAPVQVASLQTLHVRGERPPAQLVIVDECHRAMGATVRDILDAYAHAGLLGLTATPQRGDGKPLGDAFERLISGPSNKWLTAQGFLVPCDVLAPVGFRQDALVVPPNVAYRLYTPGARAIVFAANVPHAEQLVEDFVADGWTAALVTGETPRARRRELREQLRSGVLQVLIGIGVFLEGWDCPEVEVVILARAFGVTGGFLQGIGRGLRPAPWSGKTRCQVLDLRGAVFMHGLPDEDRTWSISGKAVRRSEKLTALQMCSECRAVFRPSTRCPRCCAATKGSPKIPRVLARAEKLENHSLLSPFVRDHRYLERLASIARDRMRMPGERADEWALRQFKKRFGRNPEGMTA